MNDADLPLDAGLIVSCQAEPESPLCTPTIIAALARVAITGGAVGVRINSPEHIREVKTMVDAPVIGLHKWLDPAGQRWITPLPEQAAGLKSAGADVIALDATQRERPNTFTVEELIGYVRNELGLPVMADVDTVDAGIAAAEAGADYVASTLSGYTQATVTDSTEPDISLVEALAKSVSCPVIAEGRYRRPAQARAALDSGAFAVVIGGAITDPEALTRSFVAGLDEPAGR